jgi:hypothetical protein
MPRAASRSSGQRHYRVLADLVDADGSLPDIAPGVLMDGDDIGRWLQQQRKPGTWAQLSSEQQERLSTLGIKPLEAPSPAPSARRTKGPSKAQPISGAPGRSRSTSLKCNEDPHPDGAPSTGDLPPASSSGRAAAGSPYGWVPASSRCAGPDPAVDTREP